MTAATKKRLPKKGDDSMPNPHYEAKHSWWLGKLLCRWGRHAWGQVFCKRCATWRFKTGLYDRATGKIEDVRRSK